SEYLAAPYATRRKDMQPESIPYRIVGTVDGTTLDYDPPTDGAPPTLASGQVVDFETTLAFRVRSQDADHPFYVAQTLPGCEVSGGSRTGSCLGDEEVVNIPPPAQFLSKYVFFADPTYPTTSLVLTRKRTSTGFHDVTIDCAGQLVGWLPVGGAGDY